jgi:hypothetical protein
MGRYDIYLELDSEFKISKRIIGPKGNHMKKILNDVLSRSKMQHLQVESIAKIRLRGRGSGFLEGESNLESDEILNLCISSKDPAIFQLICEEIEKLLFKVSVDFKDHYFKTHKKLCEGTAYRKYELKKNGFEFVKQVNLEQINSSLDFIDPVSSKKEKLKENEIIRLIRQRDKARKQGRYKEADNIRLELKREGILLVDEKHTNGQLCKTAWKYLD